MGGSGRLYNCRGSGKLAGAGSRRGRPHQLGRKGRVATNSVTAPPVGSACRVCARLQRLREQKAYLLLSDLGRHKLKYILYSYLSPPSPTVQAIPVSEPVFSIASFIRWTISIQENQAFLDAAPSGRGYVLMGLILGLGLEVQIPRGAMCSP